MRNRITGRLPDRTWEPSVRALKILSRSSGWTAFYSMIQFGEDTNWPVLGSERSWGRRKRAGGNCSGVLQSQTSGWAHLSGDLNNGKSKYLKLYQSLHFQTTVPVFHACLVWNSKCKWHWLSISVGLIRRWMTNGLASFSVCFTDEVEQLCVQLAEWQPFPLGLSQPLPKEFSNRKRRFANKSPEDLPLRWYWKESVSVQNPHLYQKAHDQCDNRAQWSR